LIETRKKRALELIFGQPERGGRERKKQFWKEVRVPENFQRKAGKERTPLLKCSRERKEIREKRMAKFPHRGRGCAKGADRYAREKGH